MQVWCDVCGLTEKQAGLPERQKTPERVQHCLVTKPQGLSVYREFDIEVSQEAEKKPVIFNQQKADFVVTGENSEIISDAAHTKITSLPVMFGNGCTMAASSVPGCTSL